MQIQNLNTLVDTVRHEIIERYRPGEDDPHLKVLQAAHISDDEYFSHMVLDDLNLIIRDIRETHKKDSESAPQTTVANELFCQEKRLTMQPGQRPACGRQPGHRRRASRCR